MVYPRRFIPRFLVAVLGLLGKCGACAEVVNVDFNIGFVGTYSGQGAYADPGNNYWNRVTSTTGGSNFTASNGTTSTGLSISLSGVDMGFGGTPSFGGGLLGDYYYTYDVATFTIGGLTAGQNYSFYFYSQAGSSGATDRAAIFTLNGVSQSVTGDYSGSFANGVNYTVFSLVPSSSSVSGSFMIDAGNGSSEAEFNGMQIVSAIPEPSTSAMIGGMIALAGAMVVRRRMRDRAGRVAQRMPASV